MRQGTARGSEQLVISSIMVPSIMVPSIMVPSVQVLGICRRRLRFDGEREREFCLARDAHFAAANQQLYLGAEPNWLLRRQAGRSMQGHDQQHSVLVAIVHDATRLQPARRRPLY
jgi:hypothetical protein